MTENRKLGETWSRGTSCRLTLAVNEILNVSVCLEGAENVISLSPMFWKVCWSFLMLD